MLPALRSYLCIAVVLFHAGMLRHDVVARGGLAAEVAFAYVSVWALAAVDVFFFLSGYLTWKRRHARSRRSTLVRRARRLLALTATPLALSLLDPAPRRLGARNALGWLLHVGNLLPEPQYAQWLRANPYMLPCWSNLVDAQATLVLVLLRHRLGARGLAALCALSVAYIAAQLVRQPCLTILPAAPAVAADDAEVCGGLGPDEHRDFWWARLYTHPLARLSPFAVGALAAELDRALVSWATRGALAMLLHQLWVAPPFVATQTTVVAAEVWWQTVGGTVTALATAHVVLADDAVSKWARRRLGAPGVLPGPEWIFVLHWPVLHVLLGGGGGG